MGARKFHRLASNVYRQYYMITKIETWELVKSQLTESELDVLKVFFEGYGRIPYKIAMYGQKYGLCRSDVYKARRLCLERIKTLVE